jgi:hypothetical protein
VFRPQTDDNRCSPGTTTVVRMADLLRQSSRTARSSSQRRPGSATISISMILPLVIVKPNTTRGRPPGAHSSRGSVDERRLCEPGMPREGVGHGRRTADFPRGAQLHGCAVGPEHAVGVEQRAAIPPRFSSEIFLPRLTFCWVVVYHVVN